MTFSVHPSSSMTLQRLRRTGLSLSIILLLSACGGGSDTAGTGNSGSSLNPPPSGEEMGASLQALGGKKALIVNIDGLTYETLLQAQQSGLYPALAGLTIAPAQTGGYAGTAAEQRTLPDPGWASLLTGVWADQHGLRGIGSEPKSLSAPTLLALASTPPQAAVALSSADYRLLMEADMQAGRAIEAVNCVDSDGCVSEQAQQYLEQGKSLILAQIQEPAKVAAQNGLGSTEYQTAVTQSLNALDGLVSIIKQRQSAEESEDWLMIVTTGYGLDEFGGTNGSQFKRNKTSFIASNQKLASLPAQGSVVDRNTEMNSLAGIIDIAPTVLFHLGLLGEDYRFRGSPLQAESRVHNLSFSKDPSANTVELRWNLQGGMGQELRVVRDGQLIATLPAGTTSYTDTLPSSETVQTYTLHYSIQTGQAASTIKAEVGYKPPPKLADTLTTNLYSYYTFGAHPLSDSQGGSTLQPATSTTPVGQLIAGDFAESASLTGGLRLLGSNKDANGNRGYRLSLSQDLFSASSVPKLTVGFWFRTPKNCIGDGAPIIANKNYDSGSNPGFAMALFNSNGCDIRFNAGYGGGRNESQGYTITPDQWAYVAVVIDKAEGKMLGHVFDSKKGAQFGSIHLEQRTIQALGGQGGGVLSVNEDITNQYYQRWGHNNINMDFGELAVWDRALTTDELTSIYESRQPLSSLQP